MKTATRRVARIARSVKYAQPALAILDALRNTHYVDQSADRVRIGSTPHDIIGTIGG
ncbi:MAG TPA: hypothetical protein VGY56_20745 [Verrucomicrobiae bacterium]|nr:hypothetical protein [Verrucomicrobiae bacterium]